MHKRCQIETKLYTFSFLCFIMCLFRKMVESAVFPEGYSIEILRPDQWEETLPIAVDQFAAGDPLAVMLHMNSEELKQIVVDPIKECVESGISLAVRWQSTGEIVGVLLANTFTKGVDLTWKAMEDTTKHIKIYVQISKEIETSVDSFDQDNRIKVALEHMLLCVHEKHRGKGLGIAMAQKLDEIGKAHGCQVSTVTVSNIASRKVYQKLGYKNIHKIAYDSFIIDGIKVFDTEAGNGTKGFGYMMKMLM